MPRVSNAFEDYTSIKPLNNKKKHNKFFIMLKLNSIYVRPNTRYSSHSKSENRLALQVILEFFLTV